MAIEVSLPVSFDMVLPRMPRALSSRSNVVVMREQSPLADRDQHLQKKLQRISEREGEDAILTGGTRSLHRRLLALNVREPLEGLEARSGRGMSNPHPLTA